MFKFNSYDNSILMTRGDKATITLARLKFNIQKDDIITFRVYEKDKLDELPVLEKETIAGEEANVEIVLDSQDTKIGKFSNKPVVYWYEIEINNNNTIIGYDDDGAKTLTLYPEGKTEIKENEDDNNNNENNDDNTNNEPTECTWSEWETITEPTCTEDGEKERHCINHDDVEKEVIPALGHDYEVVVTGGGNNYDPETEEFLGKTWQYNKVCKRCTDTVGPFTKTFDVATCEHDYVRSRTGSSENIDIMSGDVISITYEYKDTCKKCGNVVSPIYETKPVNEVEE